MVDLHLISPEVEKEERSRRGGSTSGPQAWMALGEGCGSGRGWG